MENLIVELRAARKKKRMTQAALAHSVGLPQSHISSIERGNIDIRLSTFIQISRVLDHEVMLIPRQLYPLIKSITDGKEDVETTPRWQPDQEED